MTDEWIYRFVTAIGDSFIRMFGHGSSVETDPLAIGMKMLLVLLIAFVILFVLAMIGWGTEEKETKGDKDDVH